MNICSRIFAPLLLAMVCGLPACAWLALPVAYPVWVLNPPQDNETDLWGVGQGPDTDSATRAALRQIAARLRVSVSAVTQSSVTVDQQSVFRTDQTRLQEIVRETEFTGVSIRQSARSSDGVALLVRVDRRAFAAETASRFHDLNRLIQRRLTAVDDADPLAAYRALRGSMADADQAIALGQLLRVVDANALQPSALEQLGLIRQRMSEAAARVTVRLEYAQADADLAALVTQWLTQAGFQRVSSDAAARLHLQVQTRVEPLFDTWNCRLGLNLQWMDQAGLPVATRSHEVTGASLESAFRARQNAVRRMGQTVQGADVSAALGLSQ